MEDRERIFLNIPGLSLEQITELAALGDYDPETGELILRLNEEQARNVKAGLEWALDEGLAWIEEPAK